MDKLVKVRSTNGEYRWLMLHIEVQGAPEKEFAKRMFTYFYRLTERFSEPVVSMAILTDAVLDFYRLARKKNYIRKHIFAARLMRRE